MFGPAFESKVSHLGRRKAEIVWYFEETTDAEVLTNAFADLNYSLNWCKLSVGKMHCLVSSSHVWCFGRRVDTDLVQPGDEEAGLDLAGEEALAIQGYGLRAQNVTFMDTKTPQEKMALAGNAFNGAAISACFMAFVCCAPWAQAFTIGTCSEESAEEPDLDRDEASSAIVSSPVSTPAAESE